MDPEGKREHNLEIATVLRAIGHDFPLSLDTSDGGDGAAASAAAAAATIGGSRQATARARAQGQRGQRGSAQPLTITRHSPRSRPPAGFCRRMRIGPASSHVGLGSKCARW